MEILQSAGADLFTQCSDPLIHRVIHQHGFGSMIYLLKKNADITVTSAIHGPEPTTVADLALDHCPRRYPTSKPIGKEYAFLKLCFVAGGGLPSKCSLFYVRCHPAYEFMQNYLPEYQDRHPVPELRELCRKTTRIHLLEANPPGNLFTYVPMLKLPTSITSYLLYGVSLEDLEDEVAKEYQKQSYCRHNYCPHYQCSIDRRLGRKVGKVDYALESDFYYPCLI